MGPILPGSTIGIVGGGQLGRMFTLVARRMGYRTVVLDPDPYAPAGAIADEHLIAPLTDVSASLELASKSEVVTLEWENADISAIRALAEIVPVRPGAHVLEIAQNRVLEKETARQMGLDTVAFRAIRSLSDLEAGLAEIGVPAVLKTATGGYDGKGQRLIEESATAANAFHALGGGTVELILEEWIDFRLEASIICARSSDGSISSFPLVENIHSRGILDVTLVPARVADTERRAAVTIGETLIAGLDVVGLLAVELFITADDRVLVNEIAPRPHNSGHYTWEACSISQFEQQLRAVCGLPLADPVLFRPAAMANLLGEHVGTGAGIASVVDALRAPMLSLHLYGKRTARTGRKMGHLTALADSAEEAFERVSRARGTLVEGFQARAPNEVAAAEQGGG